MVFSSAVGAGLAVALGAGLSVAVTAAPGEVAAPGAAGAAGPPGGTLVAGSCAGAAGFAAAGAPGLVAVAGDVCGGAAGDCANEVSVNASEHEQISNVFIILRQECVWLELQYKFPLIADDLVARRVKLFTFSRRPFASRRVHL